MFTIAVRAINKHSCGPCTASPSEKTLYLTISTALKTTHKSKGHFSSLSPIKILNATKEQIVKSSLSFLEYLETPFRPASFKNLKVQVYNFPGIIN